MNHKKFKSAKNCENGFTISIISGNLFGCMQL